MQATGYQNKERNRSPVRYGFLFFSSVLQCSSQALSVTASTPQPQPITRSRFTTSHNIEADSLLFYFFYLSYSLIYYFALFFVLLSSSFFVYFNSSFLSRLTHSLIIVCIHPLFSLLSADSKSSFLLTLPAACSPFLCFFCEWIHTHALYISLAPAITHLCVPSSHTCRRMHLYMNERARVCIIHVSLFSYTLLTRYFILK